MPDARFDQHDRDRITRTEVDLAHLVKQVDAMADKIEHMTTILDQAKGGWKVMLWVGTISGAVGAAAVKLFPWIATLPK